MSSAVCDCSGCFGEGAQLSEELIEQIAAEDEELMEMYLDGGYEEERWLNKMAQLVAKRELFPCFRGSALQDEGIEQLLCGLDRLTLALPAVEEFSGIAWQVRHDPRGERVVLIKVQSGKLSARDQVHFLTADGQEASEKSMNCGCTAPANLPPCSRRRQVSCVQPPVWSRCGQATAWGNAAFTATAS